MKAEVEVLHPGLFSTVQDFGRNGFRKFGVPGSGAMDKYASKTANLILQNSANAAVMEITQMGPKLKFGAAAKIAICGAELSPRINENQVENNVILKVEEGDILSFGMRRTGCRAYIAIADGFQTPRVLESRSWYEDITESYRLEKGMSLPYKFLDEDIYQTFASLKFKSDYIHKNDIDVFEGPEFHLLSGEQQEKLNTFQFSIDKNNNRMAIQLQGKLQNSLKSIITGPVLPGTVQLTPSGKLIVLMRDCQTTGGYPRVLQLSAQGINSISQKLAGEEISFNFL